MIMSNRVTLEEMEQMAARLPLSEQLKLIAHICEQLSATANSVADERNLEHQVAQADAWLAECDAVAESIEGEFDSAKDIREIREDRASRL
jgi:hypothetical protein